MIIATRFISIVFQLVIIFTTFSHSVYANEYPIVVTSNVVGERLGIASDRLGGQNPRMIECYYYGDGGIGVRISEDYLKHFQTKGFTRRSLCMAIVSGIKYHPESGERLATVQFIDEDMINRGEEEYLAITEELPISIPDCFSRALPYSDCKFNFDSKTGSRLTEQHTKAYALAGKEVEARLSNPNKANLRMFESFQVTDGRFPRNQSLQSAGYSVLNSFEDDIWIWASFFDFSPVFPRGYGYAIYADGAAGPSLSESALKAALNRKGPAPQLDPDAVKNLWDAIQAQSDTVEDVR